MMRVLTILSFAEASMPLLCGFGAWGWANLRLARSVIRMPVRDLSTHAIRSI